ncbi:MAG: glycosyltransferase family 2 protein [Gammaproteobacteria bacterium]|nr:glycosyltransferase family 2 protein [Gammaproteobacteria bacterium]
MLIILIILTITCMLLIIYHHVGYPLLLKKLTEHSSVQSALPTKKRHACALTPVSITLVIPAYNEQQYIAEKIRNLAILDYPPELLKVIIACDGCHDKTAQIARQTITEFGCQSLNIEIIEFAHNCGKVAIINTLLPQLTTDIIAMSDVSALISIDALIQANLAFCDQQVGLVTGHYLLANPGSRGEQTYWQYQSDIKQREAQLSSIIGAHGAFYLIRRELFLPLARNTINDDFVIAMAVVEQGYRAIYDPTINTIELEQATNKLELRRRQRIAAGNLQQLIRFKGLLMPKYRGVAFSFASGKALRVFMPLVLIGAWLGSLLLCYTNPFFALTALLQTLLYLSVIIYCLLKPSHPNQIWQTIYYVVSGYYANLIGCIRYVFHSQCRQ